VVAGGRAAPPAADPALPMVRAAGPARGAATPRLSRGEAPRPRRVQPYDGGDFFLACR